MAVDETDHDRVLGRDPETLIEPGDVLANLVPVDVDADADVVATPACSARDTASPISAFIPSISGETAQCSRANLKRSGVANRAPICCFA